MQGSKLAGNPAKIDGLLSPKHVRYASVPPAAPTPRHKLRSSLQRQLSGRTYERLIKGSLVLLFVGVLAVLLYTLRSMTAERICQPSWAGYPDSVNLNIAIVTMTDSKNRQQQHKEKVNRWRGRNFDGVLTLTRDNKVHYAEMHGYSYEDASWIVSDERPASWSKILAVKHYLKDRDWVMWLDADTIITNPDIRLESLLPRSASGPDFVITVDSGGYNAGIWLLRRSEWSEAFLDRWWSMTQFIRVRGSASHVSGTRLSAAGPLDLCTAEQKHRALFASSSVALTCRSKIGKCMQVSVEGLSVRKYSVPDSGEGCAYVSAAAR